MDGTPEDKERERRPRPRIETLSDLVFGLSLSIGSIALIASPTTTTPIDIDNHILAFTFSFLILITAWLIYTTYMSVLPVETRGVTFLNVALLLLVALVPFLFDSVENPTLTQVTRNYSSFLFTLDLTGILVILSTFAHVLSLEEKKLVSPDHLELFRNGRNRMAILAVIMAVSVAPQFWTSTVLGIPLRIYMWYLPFVSYWLGRALRPDSRTYRKT